MSRIVDWVWVQSVPRDEDDEFVFAWRELQRAVGPAGWLVGHDWAQAREGHAVDPAARVLCLRHACLSLDPRCLERLGQALEIHGGWVEACDSTSPAPMRAPDYATLRGMERYVASHPIDHQVVMPSTPLAQVSLTQARHLDRGAGHDAAAALSQRWRVVGAFAHDSSAYFSGDRREVLDLLPPSARRFLDVGGGEGAFLAGIKARQPGALTTLVEQNPQAAAKAARRGVIDQIEVGTLETARLSGSFDCISFLDVLEHMVDPMASLRAAGALLGAGGVVLVSIPNVAHWSVVADLLEGRWDEAPAGIHCVTHLRFMTLHSIGALMERSGLEIEHVARTEVPCPPQWLEHWQRTSNLAVDSQSLSTYAYLVRAHKQP